MLKICILAAIAVVVVSSPARKDQFRIYDGQVEFASSLVDAMMRENPHSNVFLATHNIYRTLLHAYMGSSGAAEEELRILLGLNWANNKADIIKEYKKERTARRVRASQRVNKAVRFNSTDKLYFSESAQLKTFVKNMYDDEIQTVDFSESEAVIDEINAFIKNETSIKNFLPDNAVDANTNGILSSSVFFKAFWLNKFDKHHTEHLPWGNGSRKIPTMKTKTQFKHASFKIPELEYSQVDVIELPFQGNEAHKSNTAISLIIYLPVAKGGVALSKLLQVVMSGSLQMNDQMHLREAYVQLPKFRMQNEFHLKSVLKGMGLKNVFKKGNMADFGENVTLDNVIYKAAIKFDEIGTTIAAASTDTAYGPEKKPKLTRKEDTQFLDCEMPLVFTINDRVSDEILFAGAYRGAE